MIPKLPLCLMLGLLWLALAIAPARAQPGPIFYTSLEAMMAQSSLAVRGTITQNTRTVVSSPWTNFVPGITTTPMEGLFKDTFTVQVDEVIKGRRRGTVVLTTESFGFDKTIEQWTAQRTPLLLIAEVTTNALRLKHIIPLGNAVPAERIISSSLLVKPPVWLMDGTSISNPADILHRARTFTRQFPDVTNTWTEIPWGMGGLIVPVTPALEHLAHQLIQSNDWSNRRAGVADLQFFKSRRNIWLLKSLLSDTNYTVIRIQNCPWIARQVYYPRQEASNVLKKWGVTFEKPVTEINLPWHFDPAIRQELQVQYPTSLWVHRGQIRNGGTFDAMELGEDYNHVEWTNVLTGSNMIVGTKFEWFVYPAGEPRPDAPTRIEQFYWPTSLSSTDFELARDGLPVVGQKYTIEMNFTVFETDEPPTDPDGSSNYRTDLWHPGNGPNYRPLLEQTLMLEDQ